MNYLKMTWRTQGRHKGFTLINITGLALGILCSLIIFLYVHFHFTADRHHADADRIYRLVLDIHTPNGSIEYEEGSALPIPTALAQEYSQIEATTFAMKFYTAPIIAIENKGKIDRYKETEVAYADNHFIELFEHNFIAGDRHTALIDPLSVVLTERQAFKYFGTTQVLGKTITINNRVDVVITGVIANQNKSSDQKFDVLVSLPTLVIINPGYKEQNYTWIGSNNKTFIKLKEGATAESLDAQLPSFVKKYLGAEFVHWKFHLQPLTEMHFDLNYGGVIRKSILWVLSIVSIALLGMVCINYVNLAIAQAHHRSKEIGLRKCLGSGRAQLFTQLMCETAMVVVVSVLIGCMATYPVLPLINSWLQTDLSFQQLNAPDKIACLLLFTVLLVFVAGYYPAVVLSGFDPIKAIEGKAMRNSGARQVVRQSLIGFQYTVALVFLISTFVMVSQVDYLLQSDLGFDREEILTIALPKGDASRQESFRTALTKLSGVGAVSMSYNGPIAETKEGGFIKYNQRQKFEEFIVRDKWTDEHFIPAFGLTLLAGRNIQMHDSVTEVVVNEEFVRQLSITDPDEVLHKNILIDNSAVQGEIVGVVKDFHYRPLQSGIEPIAIYSLPGTFNQASVKIRGNKQQALAAIEAVWKSIFPNEIVEYSFMDDSIARMYQTERVTGKLMRLFAVVSVIVCSIGILGLSVYTTLQRTKEMGIRKVLGSSSWNIIFLLVKQYLMLIIMALLVAVPLSYLAMYQWLQHFAYHVSLSWIVFAVPALLMTIMTLALIGGQSLKTAQSNPIESLRHE